MRSINEGQAGDGTYIPAGTGVLLKALGNDPATPSDFYYTIGENDVNEAAASVLVGVTENSRNITDTDTAQRPDHYHACTQGLPEVAGVDRCQGCLPVWRFTGNSDRAGQYRRGTARQTISHVQPCRPARVRQLQRHCDSRRKEV